jgi:hypothetical protein
MKVAIIEALRSANHERLTYDEVAPGASLAGLVSESR